MKIYKIIFCLYICLLFGYTNANNDGKDTNINSQNYFETANNYEQYIKKQGDIILKNYLKTEQKSMILSDKEYKSYLQQKLNILEQNFTSKENASEEFKILDEYNRIMNLSPISSEKPIENIEASGGTTKTSTGGKNTVGYTYYNRTAAVSYALNFSGKRNSYYSYYAGKWNCTNYTSQVLKAGGMPDINDGTLNGRTKSTNWYYGILYQPPTYTWGGANNFFKHAGGSKNYKALTKFSDLQLGDIVQLDYGKIGEIQHSMVVTKMTGTGTSNIYLSYNNEYDNVLNDKKNMSLAKILEKHSQSKNNYYAWGVTY